MDTAVAQSNVNFSMRILPELSPATSNVLVSPLSIEIVLAMLYFGAKGRTAQEIVEGINLPNDTIAIKDRFQHLLSKLQTNENYTVELANKMYIQDGYTVKNTFSTTMQETFLSDVQLLNFSSNIQAASIINQWVETQTHSKIKELIQPGVLDRLTRLVLANAVYYKGEWDEKFQEKYTGDQVFYVNPQEQKTVKMMFAERDFRFTYSSELKAYILEIPYKGKQMSMVLILPLDRFGLSQVEMKLQTVNLINIIQSLHESEVTVRLPKFKIEMTAQLKGVLTKLGMGAMFDEGSADLSAISDEGLIVSDIVHKAFMEVTEEGTEAAAASGAIIRPVSLPPQFVADHPFIFMILDKHTWSVLFMGRLCNP